MPQVPTIDISCVSESELEAIDSACQNHGFFLIKGHGLDDLIERTWNQAQQFFATDRSNKLSIVRSSDNPLGWFDRELTKQKRDHKEVFDFANTENSDHTSSNRINRWPDKPIGFKDTMSEFYNQFAALAIRTTNLVHQSLGLDKEKSKQAQGDTRESMMRLNHYLTDDPVPEHERKHLTELGDTALGYHTDPGILTLLLQDDTGGLQTQLRTGEWIDIPPSKGTIVVNMGDVMQVWTNDRYRAAIHRVLPMTNRDRISIPLFFHPAKDTLIEPIADLVQDKALYRPFTWDDYIKAREDDNYADLDAADTQIADYRFR